MSTQTREYEGKNERDALKRAIEDLGIPKKKLEVTLVRKGKGSFFRKGDSQTAKITVSYDDEDINSIFDNPPVETDENYAPYEKATVEFLNGLFEKMDINADIEVIECDDDKIFINMESESSALIIGKRGKTLEAIQMLTNIVASKKTERSYKSVIDIENYREKRETILTDLAHKVAREVKKTQKVRSLEPMNPFERRLIHVALQDEAGVETRSEGEGVYRKVKVIPVK